MKKLVVVLSLITLGGASFAKTIDQSTAKSAAFNFYTTVGEVKTADELSLTYTASGTVNGTEVAEFYVFNINDTKGFVMISADDNVAPILAYSTEGGFIPTNIPPNVSYWLRGYQSGIAKAIETNLAASTEINAKWNAILNPVATHVSAKTTSTAIHSFLVTKWDQGKYYDSLCPYDVPGGGRSITGCVATAMAQVMAYYRWPDTARGNHSYVPYSRGSSMGTLSANFAQSVYKYNLMNLGTDSLPKSIYTSNINVAKLMSDAGISVDMDYTDTLSGSYVISATSPVTNCAEYALKTYFRYKPTIHGVKRSSYNNAQWKALIENEIVAKRPVIYSGFGDNGGHCFVFDGQNTSDWFHVNWGWNGAYNGLYVVDTLAPGGGTEDFNSGQTAIINIIPDTPVHITPASIETFTQTSDIHIYPNPAKDVIHITPGIATINEVLVTDLMGKVVLTASPANNAELISLPINNIANGIYFIQLNTDKGVKAEKIVIAR